MTPPPSTRLSLPAREAALHILQAVQPQPALRLPLDDALGTVLAEDVTSPVNVPPWTNSAMDGYAARAEDVQGATSDHPIRLRVIETVPAGQFPTRSIQPGECVRIFTGAPVPDGADSVIRQEDTDLGEGMVSISSDRDIGVNIRAAGEDIRVGDVVLRAGTPLGAAALGVLASLAVAHPVVTRRPRVAILAGGDEIVDINRPDEILSGRKIASSNTHTLRALITLAGGEPISLGIADDTPESIRAHLAQAVDADLLVTTAGISVGDHDHLRTVIQESGGGLDFWKLRMRPGAPVGFGRFGTTPWIGLPGNPVSTMVTFELFVHPAIRRMTGHANVFRRARPVRVEETIRLRPRLQHFLRAVVSETKAGLTAKLTGPQGSGILTSMVAANALLIVPEGQQETAIGAMLPAILLDDPCHNQNPPF